MTHHLPVNDIDRIEGNVYVIEECTVCGDSHRHGGLPSTLAIGETTFRASCCDQIQSSAYLLRRTESTAVVEDAD